jgi:hypothetical protein
MSDKDAVLEAVRDLSDEMTFDEILEQLEILAAIRRGERAGAEGRVISHATLEQRAKSWNSK